MIGLVVTSISYKTFAAKLHEIFCVVILFIRFIVLTLRLLVSIGGIILYNISNFKDFLSNYFPSLVSPI